MPTLPRQQVLRLRDFDCAVWSFGEPDRPPLLLLHGWADTGASFQFLAPALDSDFHLLAPDLRGFGHSGPAAGGYWFPDYLADLDQLAESLCGGQAFALAGHSMGGNIAGLYAGVRPDRVRKLVLIEGFGLPPVAPQQAPARYRAWLASQRKDTRPRVFPSRGALLAHLRKLAPRASEETLAQIGPLWARELPDGGWQLRMDPRHLLPNPVLYRREEAMACWAATEAPVLLVTASESDWQARFPGGDPRARLQDVYPAAEVATVQEAGHMLHWEQPDQLGRILSRFLLQPPAVSCPPHD